MTTEVQDSKNSTEEKSCLKYANNDDKECGSEVSSTETLPITNNEVMKNDLEAAIENTVTNEKENDTTMVNKNEHTISNNKIVETVVDDKLKASAYSLLAQGNKNMLVGDYSSAVDILGEACEQLVKIYGYSAPQCADAHFSYGCACLELAKEENVVLDVDKTSEKSENDDESESNSTSTDEDAKSDEEEVDEIKQENAGKTEECEEQPEHIDNFQLAWESLECAMKVFKSENNLSKLADCYLKLGEVSMLIGNYVAAIDDITCALKIFQTHSYEPDSRNIAQIHFELSLAYHLNNQFNEAIKELEISRDILKLRIFNLKRNDSTNIKEITDIEGILVEIDEKLVDLNNTKEHTIQTITELLGKDLSDDKAGSSAATSVANHSQSEVNDISHLIRKKSVKRNADEGDVECSNANKKRILNENGDK